MKNPFLLFLLLISIKSYSQNCLTRDSIFQNYDEKLVHSEVVLIDSVSQSELITRAKNWGGKTFVNLKEVLVAETENQLVFNYITSNTGGSITSNTYIRLVIIFKEGRIKASFYDDGNTAVAGYPARTYYFTGAFPKPETTVCYKGLSKSSYELYKSYKSKVLSTMESLKSALKSTSKADDDF